MDVEKGQSPNGILIAANPHSGAMDRRPMLESLAARLNSVGYEPHLCYQMDQWGTLASQMQREGKLRAAISAGGDGTLAALVNRISPEVPVLVVPMGTENLLAKHFGLTAEIEDILNVLHFGKTIQIDAGEANGRLFLVMFSCGFDAAVVSRMHLERKGHINHWSWAKPIWQTVQTYRYPTVQIDSPAWHPLVVARGDRPKNVVDILQNGEVTEAKSIAFEAKWVFVFNVPRYAAGLPIADHALDDDGLLDVCTFRSGSLWSGLQYLWAIFTRSHKRLADCTIGKCKALQLRSTQEVPYQVDGDYGGNLPVQIQVIPARVRLLVPRQSLRSEEQSSGAT